MKFGVATTMPPVGGAATATSNPTKPASDDDNTIVAEAEAKTTAEDIKPSVGRLTLKKVLLGLIALAVLVGAFVYFGGVQWVRRFMDPKGRFKRVHNQDLEA